MEQCKQVLRLCGQMDAEISRSTEIFLDAGDVPNSAWGTRAVRDKNKWAADHDILDLLFVQVLCILMHHAQLPNLLPRLSKCSQHAAIGGETLLTSSSTPSWIFQEVGLRKRC
jgi:hypothetical protein